jgi:hypothetical protein
VMKRGRRARVWYVPEVEYSYVVNGQKYSGSRISYLVDNLDASESGAQKIADKYPLHSTRKVFHDPTDPSSCTLETGTSSIGTLLIILLPIGIFAVGVRWVWAPLQQLLRGRHKPR